MSTVMITMAMDITVKYEEEEADHSEGGDTLKNLTDEGLDTLIEDQNVTFETHDDDTRSESESEHLVDANPSNNSLAKPDETDY